MNSTQTLQSITFSMQNIQICMITPDKRPSHSTVPDAPVKPRYHSIRDYTPRALQFNDFEQD